MSDTDVLHAEIRAMREDVFEIKGTMTKVADALERLARLEERHSTVAGSLDRAFSAISSVEHRLRVLELDQPINKQTSGWVLNVIWLAAGGAVTMVLKKVGVL